MMPADCFGIEVDASDFDDCRNPRYKRLLRMHPRCDDPDHPGCDDCPGPDDCEDTEDTDEGEEDDS